MAVRYKLVLNSNMIRRITDDGVESVIPPDPANNDYRDYLNWSATNTPESADPDPPLDAQTTADRSDRDTFINAVDAAITAINTNGWDGLTANNRKQIMLNLLRVAKVLARRIS